MLDAEQLTLLLRPYKVVLMAGYPGSGKSTLANRLSELLPAAYFSSDTIRAALFDSDRFDKAGHEAVKAMRSQVYAELYARSLAQALAGERVIIDATHLFTDKRQESLQPLLAKLPAADVCFVNVNTPPEQIDRQMSQHTELYADWKRVYGEFQKDAAALSWPEPDTDGVAVYWVHPRV